MEIKNVLREKLSNASELLLDSNLQISEIAYAVGFNDPKYFSRCFKKEFGMRPKEYRQNSLVNGENLVAKKTFLKKIDIVISNNLDNLNFNLEVFAQTVCMSKQNLYHKMKLHTGMSPLRYIRIKKIDYAINLLQHSHQVQEVMTKVGFFDDKYFIKCFRQETGFTPIRFQKSFGSF